MGEVRFYHLTERPLERTLPVMLERSAGRGWRAVVQGTDAGRMKRLSGLLWEREGFLPHGVAGDGRAERQPVWLTDSKERPNDPQALFLIDGAPADPAEMAELEMTAVLFDGHDPDAVSTARDQWRAVTGAGLKAAYWAETADGWIKKAESG